MKNLQENTEEVKSGPNLTEYLRSRGIDKIVYNLLIFTIVLFIIVIMVTFFNVVFLIQAHSWIAHKVRTISGVDLGLANVFSLLFLSLLFLLPVWSLVLSFLPIPQKNRNLKRAFTLFVIAVIMLGIYVFSLNVYFDPNTGEPVKYYSHNTDGTYSFFSASGYHPVTGEKLELITKEVVIQHLGRDGKAPQKPVAKESAKEVPAEDVLDLHNTVFHNKSDRTLIVCINRPLADKMLLIKLAPGEAKQVGLVEGKHIFAVVNSDGASYAFPHSALEVENFFKPPEVKINDHNTKAHNRYYLTIFPRENKVEINGNRAINIY